MNCHRFTRRCWRFRFLKQGEKRIEVRFFSDLGWEEYACAPGSALLDAPDTQKWLGKLDPSAYTYSWIHPDPRMGDLQQKVAALVEKAQRVQADPIETFFHIKALALAANGQDMCVSLVV